MKEYFTDPILRAPTIGSMLMCFASSLIGVLVFIRKRSLLGEALSHAAYPGVVVSVLLGSVFFSQNENLIVFVILVGAFISATLGLLCIDWMQRKLKVKNDAALCFVLSSFFGVGILLASRLQITHALWYKQIQVYLYGQVATMTNAHILLYALFSMATVLVIFLLYRPLLAVNFDRGFASSIGMRPSLIDKSIFFFLLLAIVIGIRSVGVVLMSGMLIAPAAAARQLTGRLFSLFLLSGTIGLASGFFGNFLSLEIPKAMNASISLPTGPMILLVAALICFLALLFSPQKGIFFRLYRIARFKDRCRMENALKALWKNRDVKAWFILYRLRLRGDVNREGKLTEQGMQKAAQIIRLHRLWEVYLVDYLGQRADKVHRNAEEMEHIITPELEKQLTELLQDPKHDPHLQPIPTK